MTTTTKKAKPVKTVKAQFNAEGFFHAGLTAGHHDAAERELILACAKADVEKALAQYVLGYVCSGLAKAGAAIDAATRAKAQAILDGVNPEAKTVPEGKVRRTKEQHDLCRAGARRFNRMRAKAGIAAANNSGGARDRKAKAAEGAAMQGEAKPVKQVSVKIVPKTAKDVAAIAGEFRSGWVNFLTATKELALPDEARTLANDITVMLNRFAVIASGMKPDTK